MFSKKRKVLYMVLTIVLAVLFVVFIAATIVCNMFAPAVHIFFNTETSTTSGERGEDFFKKDASSAEEQMKNAQEVVERIGAEGSVLLKNENSALPLAEGAKVTLLGKTSVDLITGGTGSGSVAVTGKNTVKSAMEQAGLKVNEAMWNFYASGEGSRYKRESGSGSLNNVLPDFTTFKINEVPQSAYSSAEWGSVKDYGDAAIIFLGSR